MFVLQSFNPGNGEKLRPCSFQQLPSVVCSPGSCSAARRSLGSHPEPASVCSLHRVRGEPRRRQEPGVPRERAEADPGSAGEFLRTWRPAPLLSLLPSSSLDCPMTVMFL